MNRSRHSIVPWVVAFALCLAVGCKKPVSQPAPPPGFNRPLTENEKKARGELHETSESLHRESTDEHAGKIRKADRGGGTLTVGGQTLNFSEMFLKLGPLNTPGDVGGGQAPSELFAQSTNGPSLRVSSLAIESATNAQQIAGQSLTFNSSSNAVAEITAMDGDRWALENTAINFTHAEQRVIFFTIEGKASDPSGQKPEKIKVSGELRARVQSETDSEDPSNP